jgi:hypothetical protein
MFFNAVNRKHILALSLTLAIQILAAVIRAIILGDILGWTLIKFKLSHRLFFYEVARSDNLR